MRPNDAVFTSMFPLSSILPDPREIEFVENVPKTISSKIWRVQLREMERQKKSAQQLGENLQLHIYFTPADLKTVEAPTDDVYIVIDLVRATTSLTTMFESGATRVFA